MKKVKNEAQLLKKALERNDSDFDELYEQSYLETNLKKRELLYTKMDSLVMQVAPIVPLFYDEVVRFTRKNISGLGINPTNLLDLKNVKKNR